MADTLEPLGLPISASTEDERPRRRLRRRRLPIDADGATKDVLQFVKEAQDERTEWMKLRAKRYAKLRGWLESEEDSPWANVHVPVMMTNCLRAKAGLFNAVLGIRPVMTPKVVQLVMKDAAEQANDLIEFQIFTEAEGERRMDRIIESFVDEGTFVTHQRWVKDVQRLHDLRVLPRPARPLIEAMVAELIPILGLQGVEELTALDEDGYEWTGVIVEPDAAGGIRRDLEIDIYDKDEDKIEVCLSWEATVYDGPTITVHDLEDVVVPIRSENPQPVSAQNPFGAPWIARLIRVPTSEIKRRMADGTYDLLSTRDEPEIEAAAISRTEEDTVNEEQVLKSDRDERAGFSPDWADDLEWITVIEWYGPRQVTANGSHEELILTVLKEPELLARARYLTEIYPGVPVTRPFAHECFIPVPGEFYGIGLPELMEGMHDLVHSLVNENIDNGALANRPFGFYRPSSGLKADRIRIEPGVLHPTDVPQQDVYFPALPQANQEWSFNMIGLVTQWMDRLTQIGPLQSGQVPQGKASALRTASTTFAILQQGAAMPEQILRRLFIGLAQIWHQIHQMNAKYLAKGKQYLVAGKALDQEEAYRTVDDPQMLAVPVLFDFQATLLNTNKGLVSQALSGIGAALFTPLAFQVGTATPENFYAWAKDLIQANQLDPARYLTKPPGTSAGGRRFTFEEALLLIMAGRLPEIAPLESLEEHFAKAQDFAQSADYQLLLPGPVVLFKEYLVRLAEARRLAAQQQQLEQAAGRFTQALQQGGQGTTTPVGTVPELQMETPEPAEILGAEGR